MKNKGILLNYANIVKALGISVIMPVLFVSRILLFQLAQRDRKGTVSNVVLDDACWCIGVLPTKAEIDAS